MTRKPMTLNTLFARLAGHLKEKSSEQIDRLFEEEYLIDEVQINDFVVAALKEDLNNKELMEEDPNLAGAIKIVLESREGLYDV